MDSPTLRLIAPAQRPLAALLAFLMVTSALTEGIGLVLLVPMLAMLGSGDNNRVVAVLDAMGMPQRLGPLLVLFVALVLLRGVINFARSLTGTRLELEVVDTLRRRAWRALLRADWRVLSAMRQSTNSSLLISNVDQAGYGVSQAAGAMAAIVTLGGLGLAAAAIAPAVALGGAIAALLVLLAYRRMRARASELGQQLGTAYHAMHASVGESLGALRMIKSLGSQAQAEASALSGFARMAAARLAYQRNSGLGQLALQFGGALALAIMVWLAVDRWHMGAETILPLVAMFARGLPLIGALQESWQNYAYARPAIGSVYALIEKTEAAREPDALQTPAAVLAQAITLEEVTVRFDPEASPALDRVSLTIPAGAIAAIIGPSGAGKSTLADLLGGLISPDNGSAWIDGQALDAGQRQAWRTRVAYVQQDPVLLAETVRANLLWARPDADQALVDQALRDAAADFVWALPEGIDTIVGDGGRVLSGGERQRLMLARALLRQPSLLILDEATSALDRGNEAQVAEAIGKLKGRMTIVVIAHRGLLTDLADCTYVLEAGKLVS